MEVKNVASPVQAKPTGMAPPARKYKMLVYLGNKGDSGSPFEMAGCKFEKGVVTPVLDDVYLYFKDVHLFREIRSVQAQPVGPLQTRK